MVPQTQDDVVGENKKSGNDETLDILRGQRSTQPLPVDPDELGLVPAFVVGDVFAAELSDRYCILSHLAASSLLCCWNTFDMSEHTICVNYEV